MPRLRGVEHGGGTARAPGKPEEGRGARRLRSPAPAAGQGAVPPTGDALPALPLALLAAASAAALALLVYRRSRR